MFENTYWNSTGKYQHFSDELNNFLPAQGRVDHPRKNRALEKYRRACNCYYDLYNNGLGNRLGEVNSVMGVAPTQYRRVKWIYRAGFKPAKNYHFTEEFYNIIEARMNEIVVAAAIEQGVFS